MRFALLILLAAACAAPPELVAPGGLPTAPPGAGTARVVRVVDGDTVVLAGIDVGQRDAGTGGRRARLIGIDTPEVHGGTECYGREASSFARDQMGGQDVLVEVGVQATDRYGRALVHLWRVVDGVYLNGLMAVEGYAQALTIPPNVERSEEIAGLVARARDGDRGLWGPACR